MKREQYWKGYALPGLIEKDRVYELLPKDFSLEFYKERTDRNLGWINQDEQEILRTSTVGIAGCGGMGGLVASSLLRLGIGTIKIADCEEFDVSNLNRQFAATKKNLGISKAFATAKMLREISDDTTIIVYPSGINEENVDDFLSGCDVVCDEIELLALSARILLHKHARSLGVSLLNCNTIGFSTNLFLYTPESVTMEEATGLTYKEALKLNAQIKEGDVNALRTVYNGIMRAVVPVFPEYMTDIKDSNHANFNRRVLGELKAPIIATNPPLASGFLSDRILLYLLRNSDVERELIKTPTMPGYLNFDAALMKTKIVSNQKWWE
jgi:molybdopterin/thiamine biosynthesis adenylyltransferase